MSKLGCILSHLNHKEFLNRTNIQNMKFLTTIKFSEKFFTYKSVIEQSKEASGNVLELDSKNRLIIRILPFNILKLSKKFRKCVFEEVFESPSFESCSIWNLN